ncbi:hypothetical protein ACFVW1_37095 [Streptomyces olivochromogenes]|uniref:hypothetical protein n=1 Tax=Streptomyces olivochromogenes TaxID=1963 RepID=UPI0036DB5358
MEDVAEVGIIWASKTGSYNHNEIVVSVDLDAEVDESVELGFITRTRSTNHTEIVTVG